MAHRITSTKSAIRSRYGSRYGCLYLRLDANPLHRIAPHDTLVGASERYRGLRHFLLDLLSDLVLS